MKKRNFSQNSKKESVKPRRAPLPWCYSLLTLICGAILVTGFFYAARQHFAAIDYGIKNAKLRQQKEDLQSEQRRLYLDREISLSPAVIKKAAKKIGLQEFTSKSVEFVGAKINSVNLPQQMGKQAGEKLKQVFSAKPTEVREDKPKPSASEKDAKEDKPNNKIQNQTLPSNNRQNAVDK